MPQSAASGAVGHNPPQAPHHNPRTTRTRNLETSARLARARAICKSSGLDMTKNVLSTRAVMVIEEA
jgi:hypothetical protein